MSNTHFRSRRVGTTFEIQVNFAKTYRSIYSYA